LKAWYSMSAVVQSIAAVQEEITDQIVEDALEHILASKYFCSSKRSSNMLRYIIDSTLSSRIPNLKERTIGTEVFNRPLDYETTADPVVRNCAAEIRKRLALYYSEHHECQVVISLPVGAYTPQFCLPEQPELTNPVSFLPTIGASSPAPSSRTFRNIFVTLISLGALAAIVCLYWFTRPDAQERFWSPWLRSNRSITICLGNLDTGQAGLRSDIATTPDALSRVTGVRSVDRVSFANVFALEWVSTFLASHRAKATVRSAAFASLADFREQPVVLIGGRTNQWTMRAMKSLPLQLTPGADPESVEIRDVTKQSKLLWSDHLNIPVDDREKAYGIIARYWDPETDQPTILIAGLGPSGTIAGARLLTTPAYLEEFTKQAPKGWEKHNIELVLEVGMIHGEQGSPHILAIRTW
jgi:hypothetical protein